jgi:uncharacterized pyridoxamine 5'-phosphate oxidase family protein
MIITFIYKIKDDKTKYYGKYLGQITDKYEEGLDIELLNKIYPVLKDIYTLDTEDDISVGILGFNRDTYDYFSEKESDIFDLLYCNWSNQPKEIYLNKKLIKL